MESAIERIFVFQLAFGTHGKTLHGGITAIVGKFFNNAVTGTAVGTVSEGIVIASIVRTQDFLETLRA
jgi:NhaP-type Na+/H+ or K+/H+ antiporter